MAATSASRKEAGRAPLPLTSRADTWWIGPLITVLVLGGFVVYVTFRIFENAFYEIDPYLSPFYSPLLPIELELYGWKVSPAIYILIFPLSFRMTCYYYRLAYYRAFFWDPPACAVREVISRKKYTGEQKLPLVLQNLHRYALYAAIVFIFLLGFDAVRAFFFEDGFHVNVGSLILTANVLLIAGYTFSCHSFRHLIGGRVDCFSCTRMNRTRHSLWKRATSLNERHSLFAWASLLFIVFTDIYIRSVASGAITDLRLF